MTAPADDTRSRFDLRLALGTAIAWLAILGVRAAGPGAMVAIALGAAAGAAAALCAARRGVAMAAAVALAGFCVALVLLPFAARLSLARSGPLVALARENASAVLDLTVTSDPRPRAASGVAGVASLTLTARSSALVLDGRAVSSAHDLVVLAPATGWSGLLPGTRVRADGRLIPGQAPWDTSLLFVTQRPPTVIGGPPWWQRAAGSVRDSLRRAASGLPAQPRGLLPGLIDGDTSQLDPVLAERFKLAGLTHLVAVSGTNCTIIVGAVLLALGRTSARPWVRGAVAGLVLVSFVVVARGSPSVLRAAVMTGIALVAMSTGRPRQALPALAAASLVLLAWNASLAWSAGFAMSVLASLALLTVAPGWSLALRRRRIPPVIADGVAVAAAAHVATLPVAAALSGRVSLVAVPANVLAEPVVAITTVLGFVAAVLAPVCLPVASGLVWLAGWPCRWLVAIADYFGGLHGATFPWPAGVTAGLALLLLLAGGVIAMRYGSSRRALLASLLLVIVITIPVRSLIASWPPSQLLFVMCDVGQGEALALPTSTGSAIVIDTGPDPVAIARCLDDLQVRHIDLLVLTHFHLDHVGGIDGVLRGRSVGAVLVSPLTQPASGVRIVQHALGDQGRDLRTAVPGMTFDAGPVHLDVLGPAQAYHGTRSDPNNSAVVLRATVDGVRILLPADAEIEAQQQLLDVHADLRADVLQVPHHGSAYSLPAFLGAVHARIALISVGVNNDYGMPAPSLLANLAGLGVPARRTDRDGDLAISGGPTSLHVSARGKRDSTVGLGGSLEPRSLRAVPVALSEPDARMDACHPDPQRATACPTRCPGWSCSSATRSFSSSAPSARSPPRPSAQGLTPPRSSRAATSRAPSCTRCSARRFSGTPGSW